MSEEDGTDYFVVDDLGAVPRYGSHAPQQEETLDHTGQKDSGDHTNTTIPQEHAGPQESRHHVVCSFMINLFSHFKSIVEREPVEENIGEELAQTEDPVHHPVRQPFCVIFFARTFNGFDSADESRNKLSACVR